MITWFGILVCSVVSAGEVEAGTLIDQVVAVVGKEIVTESELMVEARVALAFREGEAAATAELPAELLLSLRDYLVNQLCVMLTARRLGGPPVSQSRINSAMDDFRSQFTSDVSYSAFLRRYGIREEIVRRILERDLKNQLFITSRLKNRLSEAKANPAEAAQALQNWLTQMKRSMEIRLIASNGKLELINEAH